MATTLTFNIAHALGKAEAKRRIEAQFSDLVSAAAGFGFIDGADGWIDDVLPLSVIVYGQRIDGRIEAFDTALRVTINAPSTLAPVAKAAMTLVKMKTRLLLH